MKHILTAITAERYAAETDSYEQHADDPSEGSLFVLDVRVAAFLALRTPDVNRTVAESFWVEGDAAGWLTLMTVRLACVSRAVFFVAALGHGRLQDNWVGGSLTPEGTEMSVNFGRFEPSLSEIAG